MNEILDTPDNLEAPPALSQADLVDKEKTSSMNDIEFGIEGSDEKLIIATTRPELLPACVAVMILLEKAKAQSEKIRSEISNTHSAKKLLNIALCLIESEAGIRVYSTALTIKEENLSAWILNTALTRENINRYEEQIAHNAKLNALEDIQYIINYPEI